MSITAEAITFDEAVGAARGILRRAIDATSSAGAQAREAIQDAIWPLMDSLAVYERLSHGVILPGDAISGLEARPGALGEALDEIGAGVSKNAAVLAKVIGKFCRDEAAAEVRGEGGEQS